MSKDIIAVNRVDRTAVTDDGQIGAITNLFDADGDETEDAVYAKSAVIRVGDDEWFSVRLSDYETAPVH